MSLSGRFCPSAYRYAPTDFLTCPVEASDTLYVVGGLYGNEPALARVEHLAQAEREAVSLVFNGDFNWFNVSPASFDSLNRRVLAYPAITGNVEYELAHGDGAAGCGCAYPESVGDETVARSNQIHARLRKTAELFPELLRQLGALPRFRVFQVGDVRVGIVHGDAESMADWRFSRESLDRPDTWPWLERVFHETGLDGFASSHTCLPVCRGFTAGDRLCFVINNGAAGMPNFRGTRFGVITRIGLRPSPHTPLYGLRVHGTFIDALPVEYDHTRWTFEFLTSWPLGSAAFLSYWPRLIAGPDYTRSRAAAAPRK
jgi:hypothetical protein